MKQEIIVPISGGKDSTVCLILALMDGRPVTAVFNDTGWEHPLTYEYIDYLEDKLGATIYKTTEARKNGKPIKGLPDLIIEQGRFPFGLGRFCTMYLKQYALRDYFRDNILEGNTEYEIWFGMRTDESGQRARKYAGIESTDVFDIGDVFPNRWNKKLREVVNVRLPVVDWTTDEIFDFLDEAGVKRNPLYDEGTNDRVGCYPCMLAGRKVQQKMFATEFGQQRLEQIRILEKRIGKKYEMFDTDQGSCEVCKL